MLLELFFTISCEALANRAYAQANARDFRVPAIEVHLDNNRHFSGFELEQAHELTHFIFNARELPPEAIRELVWDSCKPMFEREGPPTLK